MATSDPDIEGVSEVLSFLVGNSTRFTEQCLEQIFLVALAHQVYMDQLSIYADYDQDEELVGFEIYDDEFSFLDATRFPKKFKALFTENSFCEIEITETDDEGNSEGQVSFLTEDLELEGFFSDHQRAIERGIKSLMNLDSWQLFMRDYVYKILEV